VTFADYDVDIGFGASRSDGSLGLRWSSGKRFYLGAALSTLQNIYEFRVGTGRVVGVRLEAGAVLRTGARAVLDAAFFDHRLSANAQGTDWSQRRVSLRLEWTVGSDPGASTVPNEGIGR
jgi:hypothetical protein